MTFAVTIPHIAAGVAVKRKPWKAGEYLHAVSLVQGLPADFLMIVSEHGRRQFTPSVRDLTAEDWVICDNGEGTTA